MSISMAYLHGIRAKSDFLNYVDREGGGEEEEKGKDKI